jgi:exopolysaccharide production protein ExoQ
MSEPTGSGGHGIRALLASPAFARAFTLAALAIVFSAVFIERVAGRVTLVTMIVGLCVVGAGMLLSVRDELSLARLAPLSLVFFLVWALASVVWSTDRVLTLTGWATIAGFAFLAIVIGHLRDTLQTVRALGDVLRVLLTVSLALEILSGILLDTPFRFLGIQGRIADLGPIQGMFGTRNLLGFVTVIALITFLVEYRTQAMRVGVAIYSVVLAGVTAVLTDSPTVLLVATVVAVATAALVVVRHAEPERRPVLQWTIGALVVVALAAAYVWRGALIAILGAGTDFSTRTELWNSILDYIRLRPVEGWGWFGPWAPREVPFIVINYSLGESHASALNAYFDVILQLGWPGLLLFLALGLTALVRGWLVASARRSVIHAWTPLILVALLIDSLFESFTLSGLGWFLVVLCAVRAGQSRSWRDLLHPAAPPTDTLPRIEGPLGPTG